MRYTIKGNLMLTILTIAQGRNLPPNLFRARLADNCAIRFA